VTVLNILECAWIDDKLKWKIHVDYIYSKLAKFVGIFYKLSHKLPLDCLKMLYFSFVHLHIYGVEIYANTYTSYLDKLLKLNNKLFRILQQKDTIVAILNCITTIFYLLPNFIVFKYFVLFTNLFTIKYYCQRFIIIISLKTMKFMIIIQEIKIICTGQLLIFVYGSRTITFKGCNLWN